MCSVLRINSQVVVIYISNLSVIVQGDVRLVAHCIVNVQGAVNM